MIQVKELRVGNWVEYDLTKMDEGTELEPFQVEEISIEGMIAVSDDFCNDYLEEDLNPIKLTPEILEKCGFTVNNYSCYLHTSTEGYIFFERKTERLGFAIEIKLDEDTESAIFLDIKSLHQLQNLYYALTGEELKIKELK